MLFLFFSERLLISFEELKIKLLLSLILIIELLIEVVKSFSFVID